MLYDQPDQAILTDLPPIDSAVDDVQAELDELVARTGMPGAQLALSDGVAVRTWCSGVASLATSRPVTPATRFSLACVTKTVTSMVAMTLVAEGRLDLAASPAEYLPGLTLPRYPGAAEVTVGDLLVHASGLTVFTADVADDETAEQAVRRLTAGVRTFAPPGRTYSLSNSGYLIAAACMDRVLGADWHDYVVSRVLEPTGATDTTVSRDAARQPDTARGHVPSRTGEPLVLPVPLAPPALDSTAGIYSTAGDILRVFRDHLVAEDAPDRLLSATLTAELNRQRVPLPDPYWSGVSAGWINSTWTVPVLDTRGADGGLETIVRIAPGNRRGMALFTTSWSRRWPYFDVLPHTSERLLGVRAPVIDDTNTTVADDPRLIGSYAWESCEFRVAPGRDGLLLSSRNRGSRGGLFVQLDRAPLRRVSDDLYVFDMPNVELPVGVGFSEKDRHGRPQRMHLLQRTAQRR